MRVSPGSAAHVAKMAEQAGALAALEKMNEPGAAVAAMEKLLKVYPKAPQAKLATRKIEQLQSGQAGKKKVKGN